SMSERFIGVPPLLVVLGDVVDRTGRHADTKADQRTLPCPVTGPGADGGTATRTDRRGPSRCRSRPLPGPATRDPAHPRSAVAESFVTSLMVHRDFSVVQIFV